MILSDPGATDEQAAYIDGPPDSVLLACPGSGKTAACALRFIKRCSLRPQGGVAYLSYTNTAVGEAVDSSAAWVVAGFWCHHILQGQ